MYDQIKAKIARGPSNFELMKKDDAYMIIKIWWLT